MERLHLFGRDYGYSNISIDIYGYYTPEGFLVAVPARYPFWEQGYMEGDHWIEYADPLMVSDYAGGAGGRPRFTISRASPEVDPKGWIWPGEIITENAKTGIHPHRPL